MTDISPEEWVKEHYGEVWARRTGVPYYDALMDEYPPVLKEKRSIIHTRDSKSPSHFLSICNSMKKDAEPPVSVPDFLDRGLFGKNLLPYIDYDRKSCSGYQNVVVAKKLGLPFIEYLEIKAVDTSKFYHATPVENVPSIQREGLKGQDLYFGVTIDAVKFFSIMAMDRYKTAPKWVVLEIFYSEGFPYELEMDTIFEPGIAYHNENNITVPPDHIRVLLEYQPADLNIDSLSLGIPSTHPLVLERFPYPAPKQMGLDIGGIGELKVEIPPPRGSKLEEGSVIRTSEKHDKAVEHLGYHSVSLSDDEISLLERKVPTDIEVINESQSRLRETKIIPDDQLSPLQLAHLNLARAIARGVGCVPPAGIHVAVIPPASARVRTAGLYGTKTGALYLSIDMLSKGRDAFDTLVHELGHHLQYTGSGEAEDLTPNHAESMKNIAEKLIQGLNSGDYDKLLVDTQY